MGALRLRVGAHHSFGDKCLLYCSADNSQNFLLTCAANVSSQILCKKWGNLLSETVQPGKQS